MSDDVDSVTAEAREEEMQYEQAFEQWHEETYDADERCQHEEDDDLMRMVCEECYR